MGCRKKNLIIKAEKIKKLPGFFVHIDTIVHNQSGIHSNGLLFTAALSFLNHRL